MAKLQGQAVFAPIVPSDDRSTFPTHKAEYGKGGLRRVATIAALDDIPTERREYGMLVFVDAVQSFYQCGPSPALAFGAAPFVPGPSTDTIYANTAAGLAAVGEGEFFYVADSDSLTLYHDLSGVATPIGEFPTLATLAAQVSAASGSAAAALASENKAQEWAENPEDDPVETGQFSAKHHAIKAAASDVATNDSKTIAQAAADLAQAASEASGSVLFYDTKAAANAAIADIPANGIVEVMTDESRFGKRARYRKESGVLVFKLYLPRAVRAALDYNAAADGATDDRAAFAAADAAGPFWITEGEYLIGSNITISEPVIFEDGAILKPASGVTVTFAGGVGYSGREHIFQGAGEVKLAAPQTVFAEWWGTAGTAASPSSRIKKAIENTHRGTRIEVAGKTWSVPLTMIADEDNLDAATNRDAGKMLVGVGSLGMRLQDTAGSWGAEIYLGNSQNADLLTIDGTRRSNGQPPRFGVTIDRIKLNGNRANNTSGRGFYGESVKDIYLGTLLIEDCAGTGMEFNSSGAESSNQLFFEHVEIMACGGDGFKQGGLGDSSGVRLITGDIDADGIILSSGLAIQFARVYLCDSNGLVFTGAETQVGAARINDCGEAGVKFSASTGCQIGQLQIKDTGLTGTSVEAAQIAFSGAAADNTIGSAVCSTTTGTDYHVFFNDTGGRNRILRLVKDANASVAAVNYGSNSRTIGNSVGVPLKNPLAYAATITPIPSDGEVIDVTLTGNITVANPAAGGVADGQRITFVLRQDGTGSRTMTFNSSWKASWTPSATASHINSISFVAAGGVFYQAGSAAGMS